MKKNVSDIVVEVKETAIKVCILAVLTAYCCVCCNVLSANAEPAPNVCKVDNSTFLCPSGKLKPGETYKITNFKSTVNTVVVLTNLGKKGRYSYRVRCGNGGFGSFGNSIGNKDSKVLTFAINPDCEVYLENNGAPMLGEAQSTCEEETILLVGASSGC